MSYFSILLIVLAQNKELKVRATEKAIADSNQGIILNITYQFFRQK